MKLADYLAEKEVSPDEFARRIGVANRSVVHRYATKGVVPRPRFMQAIVRETDGKVQPQDFYADAAE